MKKPFALLGLLALAVVFGGCGGSLQLREVEAPNRALVYGYLDASDAPSSLDWIRMEQVAPKSKEPFYYALGLKDGVFFIENVEPGSVQLATFGGTRRFLLESRQLRYRFSEYGRNASALRVTGGGLYFMGSFRYKKAGSFFNEKFDIERAASPSEKQVLEKVLPYASGTRWDAMIRRRLAELGSR